MTDLDKEIADVKEVIKGYETGLNNASTEDKRLMLLKVINSRTETLNKLLDQKKAFLLVADKSKGDDALYMLIIVTY